MNKKLVILYSLLPILIFTYTCVNVRAYDNSAQNCDSGFWDNIYNTDEKRLVVEIPDSNIRLYYVKEDKDFGMYFGFILQVNDRKKFFRWKNVSNTVSYNPKLSLADLDKDGKKELIVQLCHGYGTGVFKEEVHVIRQEAFDEILVENPIIILKKSNITFREFPEYFEVILKNKKITLDKSGRLTHPYSKEGMGLADARYEVRNDILFSRVPLAIGLSFAGNFVIKYKFKDDILQMERIEFLDYKI